MAIEFRESNFANAAVINCRRCGQGASFVGDAARKEAGINAFKREHEDAHVPRQTVLVIQPLRDINSMLNSMSVEFS